jgi:hypothetical protein
MHAASRAVLLFAFAGTAACTGTVPAQNAGMAPDAAESVIEAPPATDAELLRNRIELKSGISTLMACTPPVDALEKELSRSLTASKQWRIEGTLLCVAAYLE